jgi:hypothetical protein
MLHIHNGDSTADTAKQAAIPGEHLAWREALVYGPAPGSLSEEEFRRVRAAHLASAYCVSLEKCELELRAQQATLASFADHEEVVLWFDHDLFCQVQLIYLLDWFARHELGRTKLSVVCIAEFPGVEYFQGLGQLDEQQLASLFPQRREVSPLQLQLGAYSWRAYSSPDPADLVCLLHLDLSDLPFLKGALAKHLQRFPSTTNGLGRVENAGLELIDKGYQNFRSLFPAFARRESDYGFGDAQFYLELKRLADTSTPLLKVSSSVQGASTDAAEILLSRFEITEFGTKVLAGNEDFVRRNGIDYWLGGVHLEGKESGWRWEEQTQELLARL